jgi:hypothetical protein
MIFLKISPSELGRIRENKTISLSKLWEIKTTKEGKGLRSN